LYKGIKNAHGKVKDKKYPNAKHLKITFYVPIDSHMDNQGNTTLNKNNLVLGIIGNWMLGANI
jgi:hypothetical protein